MPRSQLHARGLALVGRVGRTAGRVLGPLAGRVVGPVAGRAVGIVMGLLGALVVGLATAPAARAESSLPRPPGVAPGDPERGRELVADRQRGLCLLCHSAPVGDARQQGNLAPPLAGVGGRLDEAELRLRIHDSRRVNPASLMPAYGVADAAPRVAQAWRGKTIFSAQQIEDVVAWLVTLK